MTDFIRPELRARLWAWREALSGAVLAGAGLWTILSTRGVLMVLGYLALFVAVFLIWSGVQHARFRRVSGGPGAVDVDEGQMLLQIAVIVIVPVAIGMFVRSRNAAFAQRMDRPVRIVSTVIFLVILLSIIIKERANIMTYLAQLGLVTGLLNILTMAAGFYSAKLFKLNLRQSTTISIESGIQNGTLAIVIAMTALNNSVISIPPAVYSLLMFVSGGFMMYYFGRRKEAVEA